MELTSLKLLNFRNFNNLELSFSDNNNIIIGKNGEGKTNIAESIFVLGLTKSFRTNSDDILLNNNSEYYKIEGEIKSSVINSYKIIYQDGIKTLKINNNKINKYSDYISKINIILFNVNDMKLIKDTPNTRRKLINLEISQLNNDYITFLNIYNKLIKQRNNYLKNISIDNYNIDYLSIIDEQIIKYGIKIYDYRNNFINDINKYITNIYFELTGINNLFVKYISDYDDYKNNDLLTKYRKNIVKDINFGSTQLGIHHDDFIFCIDEQEIKEYASEGQQKNAIISFKLSEIELFNKYTGEYPILILDDLFSELDLEKIEKILNYIKKNIQTFITTTDLKKIKKKYLSGSKIFEICNGEVKESLYE